MQPELMVKGEGDIEAVNPSTVTDVKKGEANGRSPSSTEKPPSTSQNGAIQGRFPPPKTDKPRPHVCATCTRSFARLEHLKRHERSHTKEKPFECPECSRCFARRDLLLRHQQKLHMTNTTSSRARTGRRESVSGASVASGKVRKSSVANAGNGASTSNGLGNVRPRANTISHIDLSALDLMDGPATGLNRLNALGLGGHGVGGAMNQFAGFDYRGMSTALGNHGNLHGLPKLDTHVNHMDISNSLRTAPPQANFGGFDIDQLFSPGTTINPAHLHFGNGSVSATNSNFPSLEPFTVHSAIDPGAPGGDFAWMRNWNMHMPHDSHEHAVDESSPSRISSGDSPPDFRDHLQNSTNGIPIQNNNFNWPGQDNSVHVDPSAAPFQLDVLGSGLPNLDPPSDTISPNTLHDPTPTGDTYFHQAMIQHQQQQQQSLAQHSPHLVQQPSHLAESSQVQQNFAQAQQPNRFAPSISNLGADSPSIMSSSSVGGSARQSSVTSASTFSITDATRQALILTLSRASGFGHGSRTYSQPSASSPLSPSAMRSPKQGPNLPSTVDIRRYVDAFIQYAHPHLPVTHMPTLSFDPLDFGISKGSSPPMNLSQNGHVIGGGCLILGMAAVGALYEYEHPASKELFEAAKKMISLYLENRRKSDMSAAVGGANTSNERQTPLWLVQAMLLTVIYGHMCGDKTAADIASTHCAALVSLARAAELAQPATVSPSHHESNQPRHSADVDMMDDGINPSDSVSRHQSQETDLHAQWIEWKIAEERKRTLFAIFILSNLLTTAYNQNPTIMNSEILLDLPCDEDLYSAESAQKWQERGGLAAAEHNAVSFAAALSTLLTAKERQSKTFSPNMHRGSGMIAIVQPNDIDTDPRPSTFGCLVLINALHNYIWETRSRHHGRQWTAQETESMFAYIEPALNAWQAAWKSNEHHRLERPNPFGLGPLSADSIPLLDQAFVRLFVNLGRSKEAFWQRDFDAMANELARGAEIVQHAAEDSSETETHHGSTGQLSSMSSSQQLPGPSTGPAQSLSPRRERHLRKAAFYAADSLTMACRYNLTYSDMSAHELPIQSAMCFFDCCQVLAEWACTVQERVGGLLGGVLGKDRIDLSTVPAIMFLENEDMELMQKIEVICQSLEQKRFQQEQLLSMDLQNMNGGTAAMQESGDLSSYGYGSKLLRITALMLEKCIVWPITHVMAKSLRVQANHMDQRTETSRVP